MSYHIQLSLHSEHVTTSLFTVVSHEDLLRRLLVYCSSSWWACGFSVTQISWQDGPPIWRKGLFYFINFISQTFILKRFSCASSVEVNCIVPNKTLSNSSLYRIKQDIIKWFIVSYQIRHHQMVLVHTVHVLHHTCRVPPIQIHRGFSTGHSSGALTLCGSYNHAHISDRWKWYVALWRHSLTSWHFK